MRPTTLVYLWSPTETSMVPVYEWTALKVEQDRFGAQSCEITVRRDSPVVDAGLGAMLRQEFLGYALWVNHTPVRPLFAGPALRPTLKAGHSNASAFVTLLFEGHLNNATRRRQVWGATHADMTMGVLPANTVALTLIDQCMGGVTGPLYPTGYPGGAGAAPFRTDYLTHTYRAGQALGAAAPITFGSQSGKNLLAVLEDLCLRYGMCLAVRRVGVATYEIDVEFPYERLDLRNRVCLTRRRGTATGNETTTPYTMTTVARSAGAGSGATQTAVWQALNWGNYGVHEDQMTTPAGNANAVTEDAKLMVRSATPLATYKVAVEDTPNAQFGIDYFWRDGVLIFDEDYGETVSQTIVGFTYESTNGGRSWSVELELAERSVSALSYMAGRTGVPFGQSAGHRWKDNRG